MRSLYPAKSNTDDKLGAGVEIAIEANLAGRTSKVLSTANGGDGNSFIHEECS